MDGMKEAIKQAPEFYRNGAGPGSHNTGVFNSSRHRPRGMVEGNLDPCEHAYDDYANPSAPRGRLAGKPKKVPYKNVVQ